MRTLAFAVSMTLFSACGGGENKDAEGEGSCGEKPAALTTAPTLPPRFPTDAKVTYTGLEKAGPSTIVEGYWGGDLEEAYDGYRNDFGSAGYTVTDSEKEEDDAEVNFDAGAANGGANGQVKLIACGDYTSLTITIRPG